MPLAVQFLAVHPKLLSGREAARPKHAGRCSEKLLFSDRFLVTAAAMLSGHKYQFGRFRLDAEGHMLFRDGERIALTPKAVELLVLLVEAHGQPLGKEELLEKVWADTAVEEGSLTSHISLLRKTLGDGTDGRQFIETLPKRGYRFAAPVITLREDGASGESLRQRNFFQNLSIRIAVIGLMIAVAVGIGYLVRRPFQHDQTQKRLTVAVLPVQNLTGSPDRDYIADGLTEEIIAELSRYNPEKLGVIARTSSMAYRITNKQVQQIGHELGADYVVESSLRAEGEHMRITAQLVRAQDQTHLWSADYDRTLRNLFSLEDEVAQAIALNIGIKLTSATQARLSAQRPINPDAYLAYLRGRYYWNKRSPDALEQSISQFQRAIQLDPAYALAYDGLADAYASQCLISDVAPQEVFPKAKAAALKALELDDGLAEAHTSIAYVRFWYDWDWAGAEAEFKRALNLNPSYATAHQWYAEYLRLMGREQEAIAENRKALQLDPLSLIINMEAGLPYYLEGRYDEAISYFRKTLEMEPNFGLAHCVLGWAFEEKREYSQAIEELEKARQLDDSSAVLSSLGHAYAMTGHSREARNIIAELQRRSRQRYVSPFFLALVYTGLREDGKALDSLDDAYSKHDWVLVWVNVSGKLAPLHPQPRFADLLRRLNFPPRRPEQS
jgi:TolB-like protein/DNA-binding winged helix-turn-helix (wHTH) protein/Flp pilus assembly protein TadD